MRSRKPSVKNHNATCNEPLVRTENCPVATRSHGRGSWIMPPAVKEGKKLLRSLLLSLVKTIYKSCALWLVWPCVLEYDTLANPESACVSSVHQFVFSCVLSPARFSGSSETPKVILLASCASSEWEQMSYSLHFRRWDEAQIPEVDSNLLIQGCRTMHTEEHPQPDPLLYPKAGYNFLSNQSLPKAALSRVGGW